MTARGPQASALNDICAQLGLPITDKQASRLLSYLALLQRWNRTYNLTAIREPEAMLTQHLADCLAVVRPLLRRCGSGHPRILDVGSGGGLPGVVLAIMIPEAEVTCVDAVGKKAAFVRQAAAELGLRHLHSAHCRVEDLPASVPFDVIVARAFASLVDLVKLTKPLLAADGCWLAMKGKLPKEEMAALPSDVNVFHVEQLSVPGLAADRCLIWLQPAQMQAGPNL